MSSTVTAPVSLETLIKNLEFLGQISDNQKYCFITRQHVTNAWYHGLWRTILGESQDINGIAQMKEIAKDAVEQWDRYKEDEDFRDMLLDSIVRARHGLQKCHDNYQKLNKTQTATSIRVSAITPLDKLIPEQRKYDEGIISKISNKRTSSISSTPSNRTPEKNLHPYLEGL